MISRKLQYEYIYVSMQKLMQLIINIKQNKKYKEIKIVTTKVMYVFCID